MYRLYAILGLSLLLAGCRSTVTLARPNTYNAAEGIYFSGYYNPSVTVIVLPDGRFYATLPPGVAVGQGTASSDTFTGTYRDFSGSTPQSGTINATFVPGSSFDATLAEDGTSTTVHGIVLPTNLYRLDVPASLTDFARHYGATMPGPCGFNVTVSATHGTIEAQPLGGSTGCSCAFSGTLAPDANNNFYNVNVTFPATGCAFPGQTANGIAIFYQYRMPDGASFPAFITIFTTPDAAAVLRGAQDPNNPTLVP